MKARIQRLRAEMEADLQAFSSRVDELAGLRLEGDPGDAAQAAVALHHAYGAIEALLARISTTLEEDPLEGSDWHQRLLRVMTLALEDVRPPVLSEDAADALRELLGFRHFFRHAYTVKLDPDRLRRLKAIALELKPVLEADVKRFDAFLQDALAAEPAR